MYDVLPFVRCTEFIGVTMNVAPFVRHPSAPEKFPFCFIENIEDLSPPEWSMCCRGMLSS